MDRKVTFWLIVIVFIVVTILSLISDSYAGSPIYADGFVFPVITKEPENPEEFTFNQVDPLSDGWTGSGVGKTAAADGHLGQDYYLRNGLSPGRWVYAAANGQNNPPLEIIYPLSSDTPLPQTPPAGEKIILRSKKGDVVVNNFFHKAVDIGFGGFSLAENDDFTILYYRKENGFLISITNTPAREIRTKAENELLRILGISQKEACTLLINLAVPRYVDENLSGINYNLSFCPDGIPFRD